MIVPECAPCALRDLGILPTALTWGAFGLMVEIAVVGLFKGVEYFLSIRELRVRALHSSDKG